MCQQSFGRVETSPGVVAGRIIQYIQENLFIGLARQPAVRGGIILPESAQVTGLPAFDRFGFGLEASIRGQLILYRPATNTRTVGLEIESAKQFARRSAVGGGRFRGKQLFEQMADLQRPIRAVVS